MIRRLVIGLLMLAGGVCAQHSVDPRNTYHRVICVVPMMGSGTVADPKRPKYAPAPGVALPTGIIGFTQVPSDDGKSAIVEFVARTRTAFQAIFEDTSITVYEKGAQTGSSLEATLQKVKKGFSLMQFEVVMP